MTFEVALVLVIVAILFGIAAGVALLGFFVKMGAFVAIGSYLGFQKDERDATWHRWEALATERGWTPKPIEHALARLLSGGSESQLGSATVARARSERSTV